jgi:hypothetical protein
MADGCTHRSGNALPCFEPSPESGVYRANSGRYGPSADTDDRPYTLLTYVPPANRPMAAP